MKQSVIRAILKPRPADVSFGLIKNNDMNPDEIWDKIEAHRILMNNGNKFLNKNLSNLERINNSTFKNIKLTNHGCSAIYQRMGISKKSEMQKLCARARRVGIKLNYLMLLNNAPDEERKQQVKESYGLEYEEVEWLIDKFRPHTSSTEGYFYKGYIFVFSGFKSYTLKTVFRPGAINEEESVVEQFFEENF